MRSRATALAMAGLAMHLVLLLAPGRMAPDLRLALAFAALILVPGAALVSLVRAPAGGMVLAAPWALGMGVAWTGAAILLTRVLGVPFTMLATWLLPVNAALWFVAWSRWPSADAPAAHGTPVSEEPAPLSAGATALVLLAAAFAAWHVSRLGTPVTFFTDSPDHVGTIRRMLEHGDAFPQDAFFRDAGRLGADPRKGLWHPEVALIARLSGLDPFDVWRRLPMLIAPLFVLTAAGLGRWVAGSTGAAIGGWALLLTYGGSLAAIALREAGLATKLADQLALVTVTAVIADLAARRPGSRVAAVLVALGAVAAHVFAAIQLAITLGALLIGMWIRDRGISPAVRRLFVTAAAIGLAGLPYIAWRAHQAYGPVNPIHTETQGLLSLRDGVRVVMPGVLWDWLGDLWLLFPLAWIPLWRSGRRNPAALFVLTASLAVVLVIFDPPVVAALEPRIGYLLMRLVWLVPVSALLAWWLPELVQRVRHDRGRPRVLAAAALGVTTVLLSIAVKDGASVVLHPGRVRAAEHIEDIGRWRAALTRFDRARPPGQVVLADPATSYAIPAFTRSYVVTLADQHSSPNDSLALRRILDARDALDPYGTWERTREVVARYGVSLVMINENFLDTPPFDYWAPSKEWAARARARFESEPAAFETVFRDDGITVFQVHDDALAALRGGIAHPEIEAYDPAHSPIARRLGPGLPVLQDLRLRPRLAAPGDTVVGVAEWRVLEPLAAGSYRVMVRFDRSLPAGFEPPHAVDKPLRKLLEHLRGERYRFRSDHLPTNGAYGVDLWSPGQTVRDSFVVGVPADAAPGDYRVRVQMVRSPHYPNLSLSDYFSDQDQYSGVAMGVFRVQKPGVPIPADGTLRDGGSH